MMMGVSSSSPSRVGFTSISEHADTRIVDTSARRTGNLFNVFFIVLAFKVELLISFAVVVIVTLPHPAKCRGGKGL